MKSETEVQRAHDILHFLATPEAPAIFDDQGAAVCHGVHDALAWVLGFPCGESFATNLEGAIEALRQHGFEEVDVGPDDHARRGQEERAYMSNELYSRPLSDAGRAALVDFVTAYTESMTTQRWTFRHRCSRCQRQVMVAPSGQAWLRKYRKTQILCFYCYAKRPLEDGGLHTLAASLEEILNEMETSVPNLWPKRN